MFNNDAVWGGGGGGGHCRQDNEHSESPEWALNEFNENH